MNESLFARKVKETLDTGLAVTPQVAARLKMARERALDRRRAPTTEVVFAGPGRIGLRLGSSSSLWLRILLPLAILVAAVIGLQQWEQAQRAARAAAQQVAEIEEVDTKLLTGDLPINAYLDEEFEAWLKRSSE